MKVAPQPDTAGVDVALGVLAASACLAASAAASVACIAAAWLLCMKSLPQPEVLAAGLPSSAPCWPERVPWLSAASAGGAAAG